MKWLILLLSALGASMPALLYVLSLPARFVAGEITFAILDALLP